MAIETLFLGMSTGSGLYLLERRRRSYVALLERGVWSLVVSTGNLGDPERVVAITGAGRSEALGVCGERHRSDCVDAICRRLLNRRSEARPQ